MSNHLVIMAGGVGSRFWPMSTPECPKQFIDVLGCGKTLLQLTVERFGSICEPQNTWVVTSERYTSIVAEQLPDMPQENILKEPCMRNTAPCIAYAAWKIFARDPEANIVVSPADHVVMDTEEFKSVIRKSLAFTSSNNRILTLGMKPTRPETGYGYIESDAQSIDDLFHVKTFREKPDLAAAQEYIKHDNFYWNAGIFVWQASTIIDAIRTHQPKIAAIMDIIAPSFYTPQEQAVVNAHYADLPNISVDYAIMEKVEDIYVCPADFGWSDLGTWGSLYEKLREDQDTNVGVGRDIKFIETANSIVHVSSLSRVVIQGLDGYIVSENNGVLLICRLDQEQRIKEFSQQC